MYRAFFVVTPAQAGLWRQEAGANIRIANGPQGKPRMQHVIQRLQGHRLSYWLSACAGTTGRRLRLGQRPAVALQQAIELGIERCLDADASPIDRMVESQSPCMQEQTVHAEMLLEQAVVLGAAVADVADQRMAQIG